MRILGGKFWGENLPITDLDKTTLWSSHGEGRGPGPHSIWDRSWDSQKTVDFCGGGGGRGERQIERSDDQFLVLYLKISICSLLFRNPGCATDTEWLLLS